MADVAVRGGALISHLGGKLLAQFRVDRNSKGEPPKAKYAIWVNFPGRDGVTSSEHACHLFLVEWSLLSEERRKLNACRNICVCSCMGEVVE